MTAVSMPEEGSDAWIAMCQRLIGEFGGEAEVLKAARRCYDRPKSATHDDIRAVSAMAWLQHRNLPLRAQ